jgi:hypothetical protein
MSSTVRACPPVFTALATAIGTGWHGVAVAPGHHGYPVPTFRRDVEPVRGPSR